ncbi:MAG TPA: SRPBCC family protein [Eoetvoesiella sp.]|uniref:CoxG family protein n=1 Tax=Eoetvoesiella sp. TaxID=1966355 RepID=UPI002B532D0D|nr:SRPBCC family protein [Eoetvoesiella sp.]HWK59984.1 SRPBCC family protein [Eoetvoesiella sp.]
MEIEKKLTVAAPRERVWELLMDPHVMTGAVPGMQSIDVISPTEYVALMKVKISFISAKFKLHTHIVEQREPEYLRAEGTGEDASVASSLKQSSEIFLTSTADGGTELRIKVNVDVLGRLGTFGLSVMKTKADRMWDEFGANLARRIDGGEAADAQPGAEAAQPSSPAAPQPGEAATAPAAAAVVEPAGPATVQAGAAPQAAQQGEAKGWLARLLGGSRVSAPSVSSSGHIRVEIRQLDRTVAVEWPVDAADQCQAWLKELLGR